MYFVFNLDLQKLFILYYHTVEFFFIGYWIIRKS